MTAWSVEERGRGAQRGVVVREGAAVALAERGGRGKVRRRHGEREGGGRSKEHLDQQALPLLLYDSSALLSSTPRHSLVDHIVNRIH